MTRASVAMIEALVFYAFHLFIGYLTPVIPTLLIELTNQ